MTKSGGALRSAEQGMNKRCSCCSGSRPNSAIVTHQVHPRVLIEFDKSKKEPVMVLKTKKIPTPHRNDLIGHFAGQNLQKPLKAVTF
jgi:hypothetical protein